MAFREQGPARQLWGLERICGLRGPTVQKQRCVWAGTSRHTAKNEVMYWSSSSTLLTGALEQFPQPLYIYRDIL